MLLKIVTVEDIQQAIIDRITSGYYKQGQRLPSVRDLASELGSNRNTVNKAYQALAEEGVIAAGDSPRSGFHIQTIRHHNHPKLVERFREQAVELFWQGMASGISSEKALEQALIAIQQVYNSGSVRIAFYECNTTDSQEMGTYLSDVLGTDVYCGILSELQNDTDHCYDQYDLILTTFHHLAEITHTLGEDDNRVIGVDTRLTSDTLLDILKLPKTSVGIICSVPHTTHVLKHILHGYEPNWHIETVIADDEAGVRHLAKTNDHLIVTHTCAEQVQRLTKHVPDITVNFQVEDQSIQYVRQRIQEIQARKVEELHQTAGLERL